MDPTIQQQVSGRWFPCHCTSREGPQEDHHQQVCSLNYPPQIGKLHKVIDTGHSAFTSGRKWPVWFSYWTHPCLCLVLSIDRKWKIYDFITYKVSVKFINGRKEHTNFKVLDFFENMPHFHTYYKEFGFKHNPWSEN